MFKGTTVTVHTPTTWTVDRYNNRIADDYTAQTVANVLIVPGVTADLEAARPDGVSVAYTLHFPKGYNATLEGALIDLPEPYSGTYRVVGNPKPYMDANCPTPWHMPVEVAVAHG